MLFGSGVVVGVDADHEAVRLTDTRRKIVLDALATKPDAATFETLCASLAPLPELVALLRASQ